MRRPTCDWPTPEMTAWPLADLDGVTPPPRGRARTRGATRRRSCSNVTRTGMPMRTSSGAQPTMLVVSRSPSCSGSSTMATTYGGSKPGIPGLVVDREGVHDRRGPTPPRAPRSRAEARRADRAPAGGASSRTPGSAGSAARRRSPPVQKWPRGVVDRGQHAERLGGLVAHVSLILAVVTGRAAGRAGARR